MISKIKGVVNSKFSPLTETARNFSKKFFIIFATTIFFLCLILVGFFYYLGYFTKISNGFVETAEYLNSVPKTEKIEVWSNNGDFCNSNLIKSKCSFGNDIPEYAEFEYFVFFTNQDKKIITDDGVFSALKKYAFKKIDVKTRKALLIKAEIVKHSDVPAELLPAPAEFTFAVIGDSQRWSVSKVETAQFKSILKNIATFKPDFLLAMGDLTPDYFCETPEQCRPNFERWRDEVKKYVPNVYPAFGNHDEGNTARFFWSDVFSLPKNGSGVTDGTSYSFDFKNSSFTFIDSEKTLQQEEGTEQMEWLKNKLETSRQRNKFVVSHATDFNREIPRQTHKWKTLLENGVFAQFSGHTHVFCARKAYASEFEAEGDVINIFIVGNSGSMNHPFPPDCEERYRGPHFAIVKIKGSQMNLTAYNSKGIKVAETTSINENYFAE